MSNPNSELIRLTNIPEKKRDWEWEKNFFQALVDGKVKITTGEASEGPDGWPYMFVEISKEADEPVLKLLQWLSDRGIGLAINAQKEYPDYIFSFGMIWSYRETAQFLIKDDSRESGSVVLEKGQKVSSGEPSEEYLPEYVRVILRQFLEDQQIENPHILVVSTDNKNYDLCFSLESLGNPEEEDHSDISEAISWFLPTHYSTMLVPASTFSKFYPL